MIAMVVFIEFANWRDYIFGCISWGVVILIIDVCFIIVSDIVIDGICLIMGRYVCGGCRISGYGVGLFSFGGFICSFFR